MKRRVSRFLAIGVLVLVVGSLGMADRSRGATDAATNCASQNPCQSYTNNGKGEAIQGTSSKNDGVQGTTHFNSTGPTHFFAGVYGLDISSAGHYDAGVFGDSSLGFGILGESFTGTGVEGSSEGDGVVGISTNGLFGMLGESSGTGVDGESSAGGVGVFGQSTLSSGIGVEGLGAGIGVQADTTTNSGSIAFFASGQGGELFQGNGTGGPAFYVDNAGNTVSETTMSAYGGLVGECFTECPNDASVLVAMDNSNQLYGVEANATNSFGILFGGTGIGGDFLNFVNSKGVGALAAEDNGDLRLAGQIFTHGSCDLGCAPANGPGKHVVSYMPRESQPSMEDFGEGQLVDGRAYVALDPTFASVIASGVSYLVFLTPEGDSRGLYVTQKSATGFGVRENEGGRSTLTFDWRIVAKPYGDVSPRLPVVVDAYHPRPHVALPKPPTRLSGHKN